MDFCAFQLIGMDRGSQDIGLWRGHILTVWHTHTHRTQKLIALFVPNPTGFPPWRSGHWNGCEKRFATVLLGAERKWNLSFLDQTNYDNPGAPGPSPQRMARNIRSEGAPGLNASETHRDNGKMIMIMIFRSPFFLCSRAFAATAKCGL